MLEEAGDKGSLTEVRKKICVFPPERECDTQATPFLAEERKEKIPNSHLPENLHLDTVLEQAKIGLHVRYSQCL